MGIFTSIKSDFPWKIIDSEKKVHEILDSPKKSLIFKHSTRCSISSMVLNHFEKEFGSNSDLDFYFLDLIKFRELSNLIARETKVHHESPQVIVLENNLVILDASHNNINSLNFNKI